MMDNIKFLLSIESKGVKLGLSRTVSLLQSCGNPHRADNIIQIVGTNGKGSTTYMIYKILSDAGYKIGVGIKDTLIMTEIERSTMRWRWSALILYLMICFYDFMFVPIWFGLNRPELATFIEILNTVEDPLIQLELMKKMTGQHSPFTLMGGGLFHLAFGAILTGSAFGIGKS